DSGFSYTVEAVTVGPGSPCSTQTDWGALPHALPALSVNSSVRTCLRLSYSGASTAMNGETLELQASSRYVGDGAWDGEASTPLTFTVQLPEPEPVLDTDVA